MDDEGGAQPDPDSTVPEPPLRPSAALTDQRRRAARTLVLGVGLLLVVTGVIQLVRGDKHQPPPVTPTSPSVSPTQPPVSAKALPRPGLSTPGASSAPVSPNSAAVSTTPSVVASRTQSIKLVLSRHGSALLHRDLPAYTATLAPGSSAFRAAQLAVYANTAAVPFASWFYDVDPADVATATVPRPGQLVVAVTLRYALRGFDPKPTALRDYLTFVPAPGGWLLAGDTDAAKGTTTARDIWDFGPVTVVNGRHSLVLAHPGGSALAQSLATAADAAVPRVKAFWGSGGWAGSVVILVPKTQAELAAIAGTHQDLSQIAALATAEIGGSSGSVGNRVVINPATFGTLGGLGRRVVITHEITHVATRAVTTADSPTWLVEGIADYVGFKGTPTSVRYDAAELAHQVDAGHVPTELPTAADFAGAGASLPLEYEQAWMACKFIVSRTSEASLIAFYRAVGTSKADPADALSSAFAQVLHTNQATFTASWASYVKASLT